MAGRPLKYETVEEIIPLIDKFFKETPIAEWTITWLALALDTSRTTLCDYEWKGEFTNTIKKAKEMVEYSYELDLKKHWRSGTIFAMKNFDWKDKIETDNINRNLNVEINENTSEEELDKILGEED